MGNKGIVKMTQSTKSVLKYPVPTMMKLQMTVPTDFMEASPIFESASEKISKTALIPAEVSRKRIIHPDGNLSLEEFRAQLPYYKCFDALKRLPIGYSVIGNKQMAQSTNSSLRNSGQTMMEPVKAVTTGTERKEAEGREMQDLSPLYIMTCNWIDNPFGVPDMLYNYRLNLLQAAARKGCDDFSKQRFSPESERPNSVDNMLLRIA